MYDLTLEAREKGEKEEVGLMTREKQKNMKEKVAKKKEKYEKMIKIRRFSGIRQTASFSA